MCMLGAQDGDGVSDKVGAHAPSRVKGEEIELTRCFLFFFLESGKKLCLNSNALVLHKSQDFK